MAWALMPVRTLEESIACALFGTMGLGFHRAAQRPSRSRVLHAEAASGVIPMGRLVGPEETRATRARWSDDRIVGARDDRSRESRRDVRLALAATFRAARDLARPSRPPAPTPRIRTQRHPPAAPQSSCVLLHPRGSGENTAGTFYPLRRNRPILRANEGRTGVKATVMAAILTAVVLTACGGGRRCQAGAGMNHRGSPLGGQISQIPNPWLRPGTAGKRSSSILIGCREVPKFRTR